MGGLPVNFRRVRDQNRKRFVRDIGDRLLDIVDAIEMGIVNTGKVNLRGATLVFKGRYVEPYFAPETRTAFVRTAGAIAERLATTYAALYARCAHLPARHAGAWFRGSDAAGATTALVYFMATASGGSDARRDLDRIQARTGGVERTQLKRWIGAHGGELLHVDRPVVIAFPFGDPTRARKAGREAERELAIAGAP